MRRSHAIKLKAVFLLIVFSLSTLVSFACAAGIDMGYNKDHHKVRGHAAESDHSKAGSKHSKGAHEPAATEKALSHSNHEKKGDDTTESAPDDCCRDEAAKFEKGDRVSPQAFKYNLQAFFLILLVKPIGIADAITVSLHNPNTRYLIRNHHPPISDTRIAIQSFLI